VSMEKKEKAVLDFLFNKIEPQQILDYKVVYTMRFVSKNDNLPKTILHQVKTLEITDDGKIARVLGVHTDITYLNTPIDQKISFLSATLPSYYSIDPETGVNEQEGTRYTEKELKIIRLVSKGLSGKEIAEELHVSPNTIKIHKKNILTKSGAKNLVQLITNCIREGVI